MTFETFIDLSVILTGYPSSKLSPSHDTQKVDEAYYNTMVAQVKPATLEALNTAFLAIPNPDHASVQKAIMDNPLLAPTAKQINLMWYTGIWYTTPAKQEGFVISSATYKNGLVWGTMEAHPMGYSEFNFGYWETPPTQS